MSDRYVRFQQLVLDKIKSDSNLIKILEGINVVEVLDDDLESDDFKKNVQLYFAEPPVGRGHIFAPTNCPAEYHANILEMVNNGVKLFITSAILAPRRGYIKEQVRKN